MKRRALIALVALAGAAAIARPPGATAQPAAGMRTIGIVQGVGDEKMGRAELSAFRDRLAALGWTEGQNIRYVVRYARGEAAR